MEKIPKILVVEDFELYPQLYRDALEGRFEILVAETLDEARATVEKRDDIDGIVMDACLNGSTPDTYKLTVWIREQGFEGHMIANSSREEYNDELIKRGCSDRSPGKHKIPEVLEELFRDLDQTRLP